MSVTFGTRDLLEYNAKHGVLICRECKYAIQKSALGSHLLRHKIYRGERRRLLSFIAGLALLEPDHVQIPPAGSPPVHGLPIISGYQCTVLGCGNLCASFKRMRRHWSESHGVSGPPDSFAYSVNLQTFFQGTKLRYFEVIPSTTTTREPSPTSDGGLSGQHGLNRAATPVLPAQTSTLPLDSLCNPDLDTLRYFHHFTTTTTLTLPAQEHWQVNVVALALHLRWLMCGLLAVSASHLAELSNDETVKRAHRKISVHFLQTFAHGWTEVKYDLDATRVAEAKVGAQMICIHRCSHWASQSPELGQAMAPEAQPFGLQSFMTAVRGCIDPDFALRSETSTDDMLEEAPVPTRNAMEGSSDVGVPSNVPPALLERLRTLPYRMAEVLEKPDSVLDFFDTLSAIDALVECCFLSYASEDAEVVWMGMESWLRKSSDHFHQTVRRQNPASLIVLAHWCLLVERAESHCWFLRGSARKILQEIIRETSDFGAVRSLIVDLIDGNPKLLMS